MKKIMMILIAIFMLSGCAKYKMVINVDGEGHVDTSLKSLISEEALLSQNMSKDDALNMMKKSLLGSNNEATVKEIKEDIDHKTYYGLSITNIKTQSIKGSVKDNKVIVDIPVESLISSIKSGITKDMSLSSIKKLGGEVNIEVNMPNDASSNVGKVEGKQVKVDLLDLSFNNKDVKTIHITSEKENSCGIVAGIVLLISVLAGIIIMMKRKKKKGMEDFTSES
jgi:hypothetical protein